MKYLAVLLLISLFFTENITGEATCSASAKKCATHTQRGRAPAPPGR